ncbi:integrase core domain-containing protein [Actinacidiphila oryziradicis]|uniref:Integrase n=1 Tax=Actinacidiphila oryziradicis TaxID=2571141 RepID=A0A4V5MZ05_9ACTN|nr:integrase core domain-containing protein [Actinacidiphila oryziradicis]TKA06329.1 integrase [Actinacidiphila oryziradicis]
MLLRLAYLTVTNAFAALRLVPVSDRDKDVEILALRHQITVLQRQLGHGKVQFAVEDRAFLAALLTPLPREVLRRLRLLVRSDTVLRWHRDLMKQRHANASRPTRPGRPPTLRSIRQLVLRLVRENPSWGYRRVHGELATLGIKIAASTIWEILKQEGIDPAPERGNTTWAGFLRSQADALLAMDFIETLTLTGQRQYILAAIEHTTPRIRVLGTTAHPTAAWVTQTIKNLAMDLEDTGAKVKYLLRDRDAKYPALIDEVLADADIQTVLTGIRVPRMNSIMERWVRSLRYELLDRTLVWNEQHLRHALREYEQFYNEHRTHRSLQAAAPLRALPEPINEPGQITHLDIRRHDRLRGILQEYQHAA